MHLPFKNTTTLYTWRPRPKILYEVFVDYNSPIMNSSICLRWYISKISSTSKISCATFFCSFHDVKRQGKCSDFTREMCQDKVVPVEVRYNVSKLRCQAQCYYAKLWQEDRITSFLNFLSSFIWNMMVNLTPTSTLLPKIKGSHVPKNSRKWAICSWNLIFQDDYPVKVTSVLGTLCDTKI